MVEDHADARAGNTFDGWRFRLGALCHARIDAVDELPERRIETIARVWQIDLDLGGDPAGIGRKHQNAVAHQHRFLDVMRHHQHGLDRQPAFDPEIDQVGTERLGSQHVERRKRLVHQQQVRMHDQCPGKADALAHAAGQFLGVGRTRSRRDRSGRSPRVPACGVRRCRCRVPPDRARRFAEPSATGNSANDWNTMETPFGGPLMVSPRHFASPEDGAISPAMMRSNVDLPDPDRPSRPTISPERIVRSTFSSTSRSSPLPFGNDRQTPADIEQAGLCGIDRAWTSPDQPRRRRRSPKA